MSEPDENHRSAGLPGISVQGKEGPIYLNCESVVSSIMLALSHATSHNPEWVMETLRDLDAVAVVEGRGMSVSDKGTEDILRDLYNAIGTPMLEISGGTAITYAKRLTEAADFTANEIELDARQECRLRDAQQLVTAAAEQNTAAQAAVERAASQGDAQSVRTLSGGTFGEPHPAFSNPDQSPAADAVGRPVKDNPQA